MLCMSETNTPKTCNPRKPTVHSERTIHAFLPKGAYMPTRLHTKNTKRLIPSLRSKPGLIPGAMEASVVGTKRDPTIASLGGCQCKQALRTQTGKRTTLKLPDPQPRQTCGQRNMFRYKFQKEATH